MNIPKVSVVIPVYNVELYLREALDSVINQTLKEIEIILVNDGSTDNSLNIIREYEKIDKRIMVISQKNQGLSGARNSGLKIANGKYIYFMDSDDYIELDTIELCYEKSEKENLDFIFFDAEAFSTENLCVNYFDYDRSKAIEDNKIFRGKNLLNNLLKINKYKAAAVLNFINLNYLKQIDLNFYPRIIHEDELFTFILFLNAKRVSYINRKFFKRRVRIGSIMTVSKGEKNLIGYLTVARELNKILFKEQDEEKVKLLKFQISQMIGVVAGLILLLNQELQTQYRQELKIEFKDYIVFKNKIKLDYPIIFKVLRKIKKMVV
ncbi:MAG: glycosyltransferase family 2 protein [Clostridium sp.]|uniref:glycosyltransferase family 2 protein n=1 Tax=Clostridium sp. TaxID=1506 RepID=UPI003EE50FC4